MTTAPVSAAGRSPVERLWNRSLDRYPSNPSRYLSLGIVIATTIVLYYQLYLSGGVATSILRDLHMSFTYYVNISVVGYLLGAGASVLAGLADRYGRANIVTAGLGIVGLLCLFGAAQRPHQVRVRSDLRRDRVRRGDHPRRHPGARA